MPADKLDATPVDIDLVPHRVLATGARTPAIGLGTFGSDHVSAERLAESVRGAARVGDRAYSLMASGRCGKVAVCFDEELV